RWPSRTRPATLAWPPRYRPLWPASTFTRSLFAELRGPPFQRGFEVFLLHDAADLLADLGLDRIERDIRVHARLHRRAETGDLGAAIDHPLAPAQSLRRDQRQPLGVFHGGLAQLGGRNHPVHHAEFECGLG